MGAWGMGSFENDGALDWALDFQDEGLKTLNKAFKTPSAAEYLEVDEGQIAIAAGEVVAASFGHAANDLSDELRAGIEKNRAKILQKPELIGKALTSIRRAMGGDSEICELWEETENNEIWRGNVQALIDRLERCGQQRA